MPIKGTPRAENANEHPPSKIPVLLKTQPPLTGTASSHTGKNEVTAYEGDTPQSELEKLDSLRSKLEQSLDAFIRTRKELGEILSAEGSSEQEPSLTESSAELRTELNTHRELTSRVETLLNGNTKNPSQA